MNSKLQKNKLRDQYVKSLPPLQEMTKAKCPEHGERNERKAISHKWVPPAQSFQSRVLKT